MGNTSATGGFLQAALPVPLDDDALDAVIQGLVVGITGLDGTLVRPRWQLNPPKNPEATVNWCAIGITDDDPYDNGELNWDQVNNQYIQIQNRTFTVIATFLGPQARSFARMFGDGLRLNQNTEGLLAQSIRFIKQGNLRTSPQLVNQQWVKGQDLTLTFGQSVTRTYPVDYFTSATVRLRDDTFGIDRTFTVPPDGRSST